MLRYLLILWMYVLLGSEANDSCDVAHCDRDQMCWIRDGLPVCLPKMKLCSAWGGSHLHTFSGRAFDFHGTCTYVLAQAPCPGSSSVSNAVAVYISGAAAGVGNATVTSFDRVNVNIQDLNITMIKGALQHVMVNGLRHRLPISLSGSLRLFPSGSSVILETGLGLVLKYDWLHHLAVHASLELSRTMCGLCSGSSRDFSSGLPALGPKVTATDAEVVEFVRSWKTGSDGAGSCRDDCGSSCPSCKPEHLETALVAQACRLLRDPKGPFTDCLKTVDPAPYIRACEADVCVRGGDPAAACDALKTFTDACQGSGVTVSAWRALANCSLTCPANSHYEACGLSCPAACSDPDAPSRCQLSCSETCQCNEGFLLSGRECVPPRQCGCTHGGSYRLPNESFWADRSCQQRCTCDPASRHTTCTPARCPHGEECVLEAAGTYGCQRGTHGLCLVQGDPHYTTFDGRRFDFEGTCIYLLAAHCPSTGSLPNFRIEVQNEKRDGKGASYSKVIKMQVHGYNIQISWDQMDRVLVNSLLLRLPSVLSLGKVKMYKTGLSLYVECDFGLVLSYNWNNLVTLAMPMAFSGATCGICGNFNGDKNDDLVPPEGPGPHHSDALTQWKTGVIPGCTDITPRDPFRCPDQKSGALSSVEHCGMLTDPNGPFRDCHGAVDPLPSFENCVSDVCLNGSQIILCQMIASYVAACQDAGAKVRNWRSSQFCELSCPANSRYVLCSSPLPHACVEPPSPNGAMCREDCECVQGFFRSGDRCVPDSECGCQRDGVYHQSGDTFYLDELCQEECTCKGHGLVQCRKSSCPIGTQCDIRNGTRNCHPTPGTGRCSLSGELHYHTFDGHVFDFHGTCGYVLTSTCRMPVAKSGVTAFSVHVEPGELHLEMYGLNLTLALGQSGKVKVNGVLWKLPALLGQVRVLQHGLRTQVETDAGVALSFDMPHFVQVTVPHAYAGHLCGLCGDFNGNATDDHRLRDGTLTLNLVDLGTSWSVPQPKRRDCTDGCGNNCPVCNASEAEVARFSSEEYCGLLSAPSGPFQACLSTVDPRPHFNSCLHDLCVSHGDREKCCSSLRAYAIACQEAGARLQSWRNSSLCTVNCPANSQYSVCVDTCAETCVNVSSNLTCRSSCAEGCQCSPGFRTSVDRCVKEEECGCFQEGRYYEMEEVSWASGCERRCNCSAPGSWRCESAACPQGSGCGIVNGSTGCVPKKGANPNLCGEEGTCVSNSTPTARCRILGSSHYTTFDGRDFDFYGNCSFTLAQKCDKLGAAPVFSVQVQKNQTEEGFASLSAVHILVGEESIVMKRGNTSFIWVNGQRRLLPVTVHAGEVRVHQSGLFVIADTTFGLSVKYNWLQYVMVSIPKNFSNVCGLCGDNNGIATDDLGAPGGAIVDEEAFGWSWRVEGGDSWCKADSRLMPGDQGDLKQDSESTYMTSIARLVSDSGPFVQCHAAVDPSSYTGMCAHNRCPGKWQSEQVCQILQSYTDACQTVKAQIQGWRNSTFCSPKCPEHSHYEVCGSACPATCAEPRGLTACTLSCVETCQCDQGFLREGDACVPEAQCGCIHGGFYHRLNQPFWTNQNCTEQCVCEGPGQPARCTPSSCGLLASCVLRDGARECLPYRLQSCSLENRHHFCTFDGRDYEFRASCGYLLAGVCSVQEARLAPFEVQVHDLGDAASALKIHVKVYGVTMEISSQNEVQILVDGLRRNMPYTLASGNVTVRSAGLRILLQADFGLSISLDTNNRLTVMLSSKYAGATCGLCGNYNGDAADDLTGRGSSKVHSPAELVRSWDTGALPWCLEWCQGDCLTCTPEQRKDHSGPSACGKLLNETGPFSICHNKVEPGRFYNNCVSELCSHRDPRIALCRSLANYVAACQEADVKIHDWRSPDFCEQVCPKGMVYKLCPVSPNQSCDGLPSPDASLTPPGACYENCVCQTGLLLSGSLCVQPGNCGCVHHGQYLQPGEEVATCTERCVCQAGGQVTCHALFCTVDEECRTQDGLRSCYPRARFGRCSITGRSHFRSFDGWGFSFHGSCKYTLSQSCSPKGKALSSVPYSVLLESTESDELQVSVDIHGSKVTLSPRHRHKVLVNGVLETLPFSTGNLTVRHQGVYLVVQAQDSIKVTFDLRNQVVVSVPETYKNWTCGLCGNFNGDPADDFQLPNGTMTSDPAVLGAAWRRDSGSTSACSDRCEDNSCPLCTSLLPRYTLDSHCGQIVSPNSTFNACHSLVDPAGYYRDCMYDLCVSEGQVEQLCDGLQAYTAACKEEGVQVSPWRNGTKCMFQCPQFSHYVLCVNVCSSVCAEARHMVECPTGCMEGCQCDAGFRYDGNACVPPEECGCFLEGRRFKPGELRLLQNCTLNCTCGPPVVCKPYACPSEHICAVKDGVMGCHDSDLCEGKCGIHEHCAQTAKGPVCQASIADLDLCWAWGDPHFRSFTGSNFHFDGTCTYMLAGSSGGKQDLTAFTITEKSKRSHSSRATSVQVVTVIAYGYTLSMHRQEKGAVRVNGLLSRLPLSLWSRIRVESWGDLALLVTDFGLQVIYDWASLVIVALHQKYRSNVYGLCAYDGGDLMVNHPKSGSPSVMEWARIHAVSDGDWLCCTDCKTVSPNITAEEELRNQQRCSILTEVTGPFAPCSRKIDASPFYHGCVNDLANTAGAKETLSQALKSYSAVCEYHGFSFSPMGEVYFDDVDVCGPHGRLDLCTSPCYRTCDEFVSPVCHLPCLRGCACDKGYIYRNGTCLPREECGCSDSIGQLRSLNEVFWSPENCEYRCTCDPHTRTIACVQDRCPEGQTCQVINGTRGCYHTNPYNCTLMRGLHFHTFNRDSFDFRHSCSYTLVLVQPNVGSFVPFDVSIANASPGSRLFLSLDLRVRVYGKDLVIARETPGRLMVNGLYTPLPYSLYNGHIVAYHSPSSITIQTNFGLQVVLYQTGTISMVIPGSYGSVVTGMCGSPSDPMYQRRTRFGNLTKDVQEFADSWKTVGEACQSSSVSDMQKWPEEMLDVFKDLHFCGVLLDEQGAFKECNAVLDPGLYFHSCLVDTCHYGGHHAALCNSIADYAAACQAANLTVQQWRRDTFCGLDCPKHSHYELCGPDCPTSCSDVFTSAHCSHVCQEGCQCDPGFILSDSECVPDSECGCLHKGLYYPRGTFYLGDRCQENCSCGVECRMACSPAGCGPLEKCAVEEGIAKCVPAAQGTCQVLGGFGYITFDGYTFAHHGTCTYVIAQSNVPGLHHFQVLASIERAENGTVGPLMAIVLLMDNGNEVEIYPKILWKVRLNREDFTLPMETDDGEIKAYQDGSSSILKTSFGMQIRFTSSLSIQLTLPSSYAGATSGLCGNYNGNPKDDLWLRSKQPASSVSTFLSSWAEEVTGQHCEVECEPYCGPCEVSKPDPCDLLTNIDGPFKPCANAVDARPYHDVCLKARCATSRKDKALCLAMEAYSTACRAEGVIVDAWRDKCPLECPADTHASSCVDSCSSTCAELLSPGLCTRCSEGCQCNGYRVLSGEEYVQVGHCGCVHHGRYIKRDEYLYIEGCSKRCWCEPLGGVACESTACVPGQRCQLTDGAWGCYREQGVCLLQPDLAVQTLDGLKASLEANIPYNLASLCDHHSDLWFKLVVYQGPCGQPWTVNALHLLLHNTTVVVQNGRVYVDGETVSLPLTLPSGVSLTRRWHRPEVTVVLRIGSESETELEVETSVSGRVVVKPSQEYADQLCGICGNYNGCPSDDLPISTQPWVMKNFNSCGFGG